MARIFSLLVISLSVSAQAAFAQTTPVVQWTFDEAGGNVLDTGAAPATEGTLQGGATRSTDTPSGSGMSLDLRTEAPYAFVEAPDSTELDGLNALTLTTWLKVETYASGNHRLVAQQGGGATFPGFSWNMNATTNSGEPASPDNFRLGLFLGSATDFGFGFSSADAGASDWTFLATTYDSSIGEVRFYIGGRDTPVMQLGDPIFPLVPPAPIESDARFGVGLTDAAPTANTSVLGFQDDVRVYNTALDLTALEAIRLENLGPGGGSPADFDNDGDVDGDDLDDWRAGYGTVGTATKANGDADGDMDVDGADFLVWQEELGPAGGVAAVPEPAAGVLLLVAVFAGTAVRRR